MSSKIFIYTLTEDGCDEARYVGQTYNLEGRLYGHLNAKMADGNPKVQWISEVLSRGGKVKINQIDECDPKGAAELESYWIEHFRQKGHRLTNTASAMQSKLCVVDNRHTEERPRIIPAPRADIEDIVDILGQHTNILRTLMGDDMMRGIVSTLGEILPELISVNKSLTKGLIRQKKEMENLKAILFAHGIDTNDYANSGADI